MTLLKVANIDFNLAGTTSLRVGSDNVIRLNANALSIPVGTTANRPLASNGTMRFNSTTDRYEFAQANSWVEIVNPYPISNQATFAAVTANSAYGKANTANSAADAASASASASAVTASAAYTKANTANSTADAAMPKAGGTFSGPISGTGSTMTSYTVNGAAATHRAYSFMTAGSVRWYMSCDTTAEGGSNAGSNFVIYRYSDAAAFIDTVLSINRATGTTDLKALTIGGVALGALLKATAAEYRAKSQDAKFLTPAQVWAAVVEVALTDAATITPDFSVGIDFSVTIAGNRTLANPTNLTVGQKGRIKITQDATGSRTLAYGSYFKWAGGTVGVLSTAANSVDYLDYDVVTTTHIRTALSKAWA